jgi:heat shock protein HslJ
MSLLNGIWKAPALGKMTAAGVISLLALTSCEDAVMNPSDLGGQWRLEVLRAPDGSEVTPPDRSRFTAEFTADGQVLARADCNGCGGRYTLDDDTLVVSGLACTLILCPSAPLDGRFLSILDGTSSFDFEDGRLVISSGRGTLRFTR